MRLVDSRVRYKIPAGPNMRRGAYYLLIAVLSISGMGQLIVACGQKGDLYLPKPEPVQQTSADTKTKAVRPAKTDGKAAGKAGSTATSEAGQSGSGPTRQVTAGAEADAVQQVATEDESAVKTGPAAASGVEQPGQE